jgi:hypothetical protein
MGNVKTIYDTLEILLRDIDVPCKECHENKGHHSFEGLRCPIVDNDFRLNKSRRFSPTDVYK